MKRRLALLLALLAPLAHAGTEDELRRLEEQRRQAIQAKDFAALGRIYAPDFLAIAGSGQLIDREQLFRVFAQTDPALSFDTDEVRVLDQGGTAVFFGRLMARTAAGKPVFASRFSHVFVRQADGRWLCVAGQSTPLPSPSAAG
jgi:uncharacterized protein (TIGR02246 family)